MEHNVTVTKLTTNNMNIKQHRKNKIIILALTAILIFGFGFSNKVKAENSSIYISPTNLSKTVGNIFDISVKVNPSGQKVCVVEGKLALNKLSCQKITMGSAIGTQTSPSCDDLSFLLGILGCTTSDKTIFTVTVKAESAGSGTAIFTGVDIIGEGVSISSTSSGGTYTITSPCSCGAWSVWQDGACGGGSCSSTQRLQTRSRLCTPSGCEAKNEYRCKDDPGCISRPPAVEIDVVPPVIILIGSSTVNLYVGDTYEDAGSTALDDVDGDITENIVVINPVDTSIVGTYVITYNVSDVAGNAAEEVTRTVIVTEPLFKPLPFEKEKEIVSREKTLPKGLLANLGMAVGEISRSALFAIVTILCLVGLVTIGVKEWRTFRKRKEK